VRSGGAVERPAASGAGRRSEFSTAVVIHRRDALDAGINLVDTSDSYSDSEEVVNRAL
jgi:aryl-alcohol dehydrogenase-like predicted oxidoreductase